jgi:hypothetical protein
MNELLSVHRQDKHRKHRVAGLLSVIAGSIAVTGAVPPLRASAADTLTDMQAATADTWHSLRGQTVQERTISAAITAAVGEHIVVRCAAMSDGLGSTDGNKVVYGIAHPRQYTAGMRSVRLVPEVCGGVSAITNRQQPFNDPKDRDAAAWGIFIAAHEASHTLGAGSDESQASCMGIAVSDDVARQLGAGESLISQVQESARWQWQQRLAAEYQC